jgi:hypothetical protein
MSDESTELTTVEQQPPSQALTDLRRGAMSLPVEDMQTALAEYSDRRKTFQAWLQDQLIEGVHFGYPPGCSPRSNATREQWQAKPSLYKAGADLVCDLMGVRAIYTADMESWQQLGSPKGTYVRMCRLVSRQTGEVIGEGSGAYKAGSKMDENGALKMAEKRAKVNATLNAYGLSDLYTQDLESWAPPAHENPSQNPDAPQVKSRGERADMPTVDELKSLLKLWQGMCDQTDRPIGPAAWAEFAEQAGGIPRDSADKRNAWTREAYNACETEIHRLQGTLEPEDGNV